MLPLDPGQMLGNVPEGRPILRFLSAEGPQEANDFGAHRGYLRLRAATSAAAHDACSRFS